MSKTNVFFISMYLMASLFFISHGFALFVIPISQFNIRGVVRCSLTGDPNAPPVNGSIVNLVCSNATTNVAQTLTNPNGTFLFVLYATDVILYDPNTCFVQANLPAGNCTISPPNGALTASVTFFNFVVSGIFGIANYITGPFLNSTLPPNGNPMN